MKPSVFGLLVFFLSSQSVVIGQEAGSDLALPVRAQDDPKDVWAVSYSYKNAKYTDQYALLLNFESRRDERLDPDDLIIFSGKLGGVQTADGMNVKGGDDKDKSLALSFGYSVESAEDIGAPKALAPFVVHVGALYELEGQYVFKQISQERWDDQAHALNEDYLRQKLQFELGVLNISDRYNFLSVAACLGVQARMGEALRGDDEKLVYNVGCKAKLETLEYDPVYGEIGATLEVNWGAYLNNDLGFENRGHYASIDGSYTLSRAKFFARVSKDDQDLGVEGKSAQVGVRIRLSNSKKRDQ